MKYLLVVLALGLNFAFAGESADDARLARLVAAHLAEVALPAGHEQAALQPHTLRCVAVPSSMLGTCVVRGLRKEHGFEVAAFYQVGVMQADDEEGVRFEARALIRNGW